MYIRLLSSSTSTAGRIRAHRIRTLKKYLHQLYLRVHPDHFAQHPKERAVNEASFQKLQQYLEDKFQKSSDTHDAKRNGRKGAAGNGTVDDRKNERLTFFTHRVEWCGFDTSEDTSCRTKKGSSSVIAEGTNETAKSADERDEKLVEASVDVTGNNLTSALITLFQYLGLEPPPPELFSDHAHSSSPSGTATTGSSFSGAITHSLIRTLAKQSRMQSMRDRFTNNTVNKDDNGEVHSSVITDKSQLIILALQRSRGIHIRLGRGLPTGDRQHFLLQRLAFVIETVKDVDISTGKIELDGSFQVSMATDCVTLKIGACASDKLWMKGLTSDFFLNACEKTRKQREELRKLENTAARHLNLRFIVLERNYEELEPFERNNVLDLYHNIVEELCKVNVSSSLRHHLSKMSLVLSPPKRYQNNSDHTLITTTHHEDGVVQLALIPSMCAETILETLQAEAPTLAYHYNKHCRQIEQERNMVTAAVRGLRLDGLRRGKHIDEEQWRCGCSGLLKHSLYLRRLLEGTRLVITNRLGILEDGVDNKKNGKSELGLPWNVDKVVAELKHSEEGAGDERYQ